MNTHWNTMSSNRNHTALSLFSSTAHCGSSSSTSNSTFPGLGFESQSRQLFVMWLQWQLIPINQSIKLFNKYSPLIDRCKKLGEGKKAKKNDLDWDLNPRPGKLDFDVELKLPQFAVEEKRESAYNCLLLRTVLQWVLIRQPPFSIFTCLLLNYY